MLIRITNKCTMGCNHCVVEASPSGAHMSAEVFDATLDWMQRLNLLRLLLISGGEPTEHPDLLQFLARAYPYFTVFLLSNGEFLHADKQFRDRVLAVVHVVQVTNDSRYYPRYVPDFDHPRVTFERHISTFTSMGRAKSLSIPSNRKAPFCFNVRSLTRNTGSVATSINALTLKRKACSPSVNIDGSVSAGEMPFCSKVGTVYDSDAKITKNLLQLKCSRCGLIDKLSDEYKAAVGEL